MRLTVGVVIALIALWLTYAASAYLSAYRLADVVQMGDVIGLSELIDFPTLRQSISAQIVRKYLQLTGKDLHPGSIAEQFAVGVGIAVADPIVAKLVSPEALIELLQSGTTSTVLQNRIAPMQGLSADALGSVWRMFVNSELGIARFLVNVPVDKPATESFRLQFCLAAWTWRLCRVELPEPLQIAIAQEVIRNQK
jgi:hypothetical protein